MLLLIVATLAGCSKRVRLEDRTVSLTAADGTVIAAHLYLPAPARPAGLILVHRQGAASRHWEPFAVRAQQSGYLVASVDLRGHGESRGGEGARLDYRSFTPADWKKSLLDIAAAKQCLLAEGVDPSNLFIAGEALGASLALQFAVETPDIQGVVLLSPGLDYHGIAAEPLLVQLARRPTLLVWSEGDAYAASSGGTLKRIAPGHVETHVYPGTAHGTDIFSATPQAIGQILAWLAQMRSNPAGKAEAS